MGSVAQTVLFVCNNLWLLMPFDIMCSYRNMVTLFLQRDKETDLARTGNM